MNEGKQLALLLALFFATGWVAGAMTLWLVMR